MSRVIVKVPDDDLQSREKMLRDLEEKKWRDHEAECESAALAYLAEKKRSLRK